LAGWSTEQEAAIDLRHRGAGDFADASKIDPVGVDGTGRIISADNQAAELGIFDPQHLTWEIGYDGIDVAARRFDPRIPPDLRGHLTVHIELAEFLGPAYLDVDYDLEANLHSRRNFCFAWEPL
jgi:hypothetical protein